MLAPPPRGPITDDARDGERIFAEIGCGTCHTPTLVSGPSDVLALHHTTYHPYSDFLLHEMGALADGIEQESAKGTEFRTAPLWGARTADDFLLSPRRDAFDFATARDLAQAAVSQAQACRSSHCRIERILPVAMAMDVSAAP